MTGSEYNSISGVTSTSIARGQFSVPSCKTFLKLEYRKGKDYTYLYGKHVGTGSLTPYIDEAFDERVDEYVVPRTHEVFTDVLLPKDHPGWRDARMGSCIGT